MLFLAMIQVFMLGLMVLLIYGLGKIILVGFLRIIGFCKSCGSSLRYVKGSYRLGLECKANARHSG